MDILNVITTKSATSVTENAFYNLEYSISNDKLSKVMATISAVKPNGDQDEKYLGQIILENDMLSASFTEGVAASKIFADYENILLQIKKDVNMK